MVVGPPTVKGVTTLSVNKSIFLSIQTFLAYLEDLWYVHNSVLFLSKKLLFFLCRPRVRNQWTNTLNMIQLLFL